MTKLTEIKRFIVEKTKRNAELFGDRLPHCAEAGTYDFVEDGFWVGGFWTGLAYLCYEMTGDQAFLESARSSKHRFVKRLYADRHTTDHDLGFLFSLSAIADYKLTRDPAFRQIGIDAADVLADRFHETGQFIQAWNVWTPGDPFSEGNRGRIIIDCMYNLPLLFWAGEETGDPRYKRIALAHAETCANTIVRPDFTTYHTYRFDPETGQPIGGSTFQGFSDESCWARGQAWAIGGYTYAYRYTGHARFLEIARRCADVFIAGLEDDLVPMWDFTFQGGREGEPRDTSAAAIVAASLLALTELLHDEQDRTHYRDVAVRMVESLYDRYSTKDEPEHQGLLKEATLGKPQGVGIRSSLIYGDYYFTEAVARLLGQTAVYW